MHTRERKRYIETALVLGSQSFYSLSIVSRSFPLLLFILTSHEKFLVSLYTLFLAAVFSSPPAFAVLGALVSGSLASGCRIGRQYYSCIGQPHCAPARPNHVC